MRTDSRKTRSKLVMNFAKRLRRWRQAGGLPLKQVASDLGVSTAVVSAWENAARFPTLEHLASISEYTGIPACQFLYDGSSGCCGGPKLE